MIPWAPSPVSVRAAVVSGGTYSADLPLLAYAGLRTAIIMKVARLPSLTTGIPAGREPS